MGGARRHVGLAATLLVALTILATTGQAIPDAPGSFLGLTDHAEACEATPPTPSAPPAEIDATLDDLYGVYEDLPGFVDVYHVAGAEPVYRAVFVESVPDAAAERTASVPVALDVIPEAPTTAPEVPQPSQDDVACRGSRPGAWANGCTASFVFTNGTDLFIGSAGHCFRKWESVVVGFHEVGHVVYREANGVGHDFALIEVWEDREQYVSAEMCAWGGPTGGHQGSVLGERVLSTGHGREAGFPFDRLVPPRPRAGVGLSWGSRSFTWVGSMMGGDSGAAVGTGAGGALGTHTHSVVIGPDALAFGTRWDKGIQDAEQALDTDLRLVTAGQTVPTV